MGGQRPSGVRGAARQPGVWAAAARGGGARALPRAHVHLQRVLLHRPQLGGATRTPQAQPGEVREGNHRKVSCYYYRVILVV